MERVFSINVVIDDVYEVKGTDGSAAMITFHGDSDCDYFKGKILPGGVDPAVEHVVADQVRAGTQCAEDRRLIVLR